jgi:glycosyltransferase involved in cell wall biosynthesis
MIDLVLGTVGRTQEPLRLLRSLAAQTYRDFRLLVVDQNADDRLERVLDGFAADFPLVCLRSEPGLSRARNAGLAQVLEGAVVGFPDDDCWYPPELLYEVAELLSAHPGWDGATGRSVDEAGRPSNARWARRAGRITRRNVWTHAVSYTIFLRGAVVEDVGLFDDTLGPGAGTPWLASEEMDYLLRALAAGHELHYEPRLLVRHPLTREQLAESDLEAGYGYALAMGRVLRRNRLPGWFAAYHVGRAFGGALLSLLRGRPLPARFHWRAGLGRLRGWQGGRA